MDSPAACGANYLVFAWFFRGDTPWRNIWRTNTDGSRPLKLTNGKGDGYPVCSPDQKWVYYWDPYDGAHVLRVPLDGSGTPDAVPGSSNIGISALMFAGVVSRDGKILARLAQVLNPQTQEYQNKIALLNLESSTAVRMLDMSEHFEGSIDTWAGVEFTPDEQAVAYTIRENGVDNIWVQPLDGSVGHRITNFKSEQISLFHWSPDGKRLGILRGHSDSDVVLLQESKQ
jgi:Tol biopolymer transport system component